MSGGYDVDLFVDSPDYDLLCTICRSVLRCPVRVACNHVFCKTCILQWLRRQETCPCCRNTISPSFMFVMYKLSKTISRLRIKCNNEGCSATFPLSEEFLHSSSCQFQRVPCPHQGCGSLVPRSTLEVHSQHCQHWSQLCPMGCGTLLTQSTQPQHNCFRQLRQQVEAQRQSHRAIASALRRKIGRMQAAMTHVRRQVALICESLEVMGEEEGEGEGDEYVEGEGEGEGEGEVYEGYGEGETTGETTGESNTSSSSSSS
ncbi:unnamed protein product [Coregonus sp. 'balchen']|uniref:Ring finger protein 151 n=1 Tax=Coregonus suidteri TaxID=861788 RepID=A0AAN8MEA4_9TELE|nr:unnamed protein product [Coregonus sp. 'balchen']